MTMHNWLTSQGGDDDEAMLEEDLAPPEWTLERHEENAEEGAVGGVRFDGNYERLCRFPAISGTGQKLQTAWGHHLGQTLYEQFRREQ